MFKRIFHTTLAVLTIFGAIGPAPFIAQVARAESPSTISYQGRLKDDDGLAVTDGAYDFTFRLYDALAAGNLEWTEEQDAVTVTDGYFSVQLGSVDGFLDGADDEVDFSEPLFLSIEVDADGEMTPRVAINSVAYAYVSRSAESFASEVAAETAAEVYGGRLYYNETDGNLYVYDADAVDWVDVTAASGNLDDSYNNFGASAALVEVDADEGQTGGLEFESTIAGNIIFDLQSTGDFVVQDGGATFITFSDTGTATFGGAVTLNGQNTIGDGGDTVAINSSDWDIDATGVMTGIGAITTDGLLTGTLGATISGATTSINADSNFGTNINTGTSTGALSLGGGLGTVAINSSDWDIDATGAMTGIGAITADGIATFAANVNANGGLDVDDAFVVADGGILTTSQTANFDGTADFDGQVSIGDDGDTVSIDSSVWDISTAGAVSGITTFTSSGDMDLTATGGTIGDPDFDVAGYSQFNGTAEFNAAASYDGVVTYNAVATFNASPSFNAASTFAGSILANGGISTSSSSLTINPVTYTQIGSGSAPAVATGEDDLFVVGDAEIDGELELDGALDSDGDVSIADTNISF
ncbi:TPA: hypothetical protein DD617_02590, partial [Candidatus Uhrbacteria bacterium]|nr:hypothetical protein [Candidatus Uhrbacteria bacterium]